MMLLNACFFHEKTSSFLVGVREITFTRVPQSYMTSAGKESLRNRCVLRHGLHHLHSSYKLQTMLVSFPMRKVPQLGLRLVQRTGAFLKRR